MIIFMVLIGISTVGGVVIIAVVETRRMERQQPSILSGKLMEQHNKAQEIS